MLYQFLDWRLGGRGRKMFVAQIERLFARMRELDHGRLPLYLSRWEEYQIFAGESGIMLPDTSAAAKAVFQYNDSYPTLSWLEKEYTKLLEHVSKGAPEMLQDAKPKSLVWSTLDGTEIPVPSPPSPETFEEVIEGSISNVTPKEGNDPCLEQSPATLPPTSISTGSPNILLTGEKQSPRQQHNLTPAHAL